VTPGLPLGPRPCNPFALVASLKLRLRHALAIYLEFVPACGAALERFKECQCENDDVRFHCRAWVLGDGHYRWRQSPINPLSMEHQAKYLIRTIPRILEFLQL